MRPPGSRRTTRFPSPSCASASSRAVPGSSCRRSRDLREVGLSRAKVAFLRDLAEHVEDGELDLERIAELPDDDVAARLTQIKGLGPWSVQMFLIFHLGRPDVLPVGDLGIRRAVQDQYGLDDLPDAAELERIAEPWRPNRSLASLYLWRSLDQTPV